MFAYRACGGRRPHSSLALAIALSAAVAIAAPGFAKADGIPRAAANEPLVVHLDEAKVLKLPERTATLVIGNPLIADVAVQPGGIMVITGKSYGTTNLVAVDRNGTTVLEHLLQVRGPREQVVFIHRGVDRETYSCTPSCERRIMLGDTAAYFTATLGQSGTLNTAAQGAQEK